MTSNTVLLAQVLKQVSNLADRRESRIRTGIPSLMMLVDVARSDTGQAGRVRRLLLGLYNGHSWPFDMCELRGLDAALQEAILAVIQLDWCGQEIHNYLTGGDVIFRKLWEIERGDE